MNGLVEPVSYWLKWWRQQHAWDWSRMGFSADEVWMGEAVTLEPESSEFLSSQLLGLFIRARLNMQL